MSKTNYNTKDVEDKIKEHPNYHKISGSYILSRNSIALGPKKTVEFKCSKEEFERFINEIIETILSIESIPAETNIKEWVALPGVSKIKISENLTQNPSFYAEFLKNDPQILVIKKISNYKGTITWKMPDGRIGSGGHLL